MSSSFTGLFLNNVVPAFLFSKRSSFGGNRIVPGEYCFAVGLSGLLVAFAGLLISFIKGMTMIEAVKLAIIGWLVTIFVLILLTLILTLKAPIIHKKAAQLKVWADENIAENITEKQ